MRRHQVLVFLGCSLALLRLATAQSVPDLDAQRIREAIGIEVRDEHSGLIGSSLLEAKLGRDPRGNVDRFVGWSLDADLPNRPMDEAMLRKIAPRSRAVWATVRADTVKALLDAYATAYEETRRGVSYTTPAGTAIIQKSDCWTEQTVQVWLGDGRVVQFSHHAARCVIPGPPWELALEHVKKSLTSRPDAADAAYAALVKELRPDVQSAKRR